MEGGPWHCPPLKLRMLLMEGGPWHCPPLEALQADPDSRCTSRTAPQQTLQASPIDSSTSSVCEGAGAGVGLGRGAEHNRGPGRMSDELHPGPGVT